MLFLIARVRSWANTCTDTNRSHTCRHVRDLLIDHGHVPPEIEDVCDEIFDMVRAILTRTCSITTSVCDEIFDVVREQFLIVDVARVLLIFFCCVSLRADACMRARRMYLSRLLQVLRLAVFKHGRAVWGLAHVLGFRTCFSV